jgi:F-type H+-transporting ATPase subunit delta
MANIEDSDALDRVQQELRALSSLQLENDDLRNYMRDPSVAEPDRKALLHRVLEDKIHPVLMHFLDLLLHKHRLGHFDSIAAAFDELVEKRRNQARIRLFTAVPLAVDQEDRLKRTLDRVIGKDCILEKRIDPKIIGGAVAVYGDRVYDGSVKTALSDLHKQMMSAPL